MQVSLFFNTPSLDQTGESVIWQIDYLDETSLDKRDFKREDLLRAKRVKGLRYEMVKITFI